MSDAAPRFTATELLLVVLGVLGLVGTWAQGFHYAVPVFLAHRQRRIRLHRPAERDSLAGSDWIAIGVAFAIVVAWVGYSFRHIP